MGKSRLCRRLKTLGLVVAFSVGFAGLSYWGLKLIGGHITKVETSSSVGELAEIVLNYISIFVSILLGVVVYLQSERVNKLEATQYGVFLGAEKLDSAFSLGTEFLQLDRETEQVADVHIFEIADYSRLCFLSNISLNDGNDRVVIPVVFTTRNTPLITAIHIQQIDLSIQYHSAARKSILKKRYPLDIIPIHRFLSDESQFNICFAINKIEKSLIEKINITVILRIEDQLMRTHSVESELQVEQRCGKLNLLSSKSFVKEI